MEITVKCQSIEELGVLASQLQELAQPTKKAEQEKKGGEEEEKAEAQKLKKPEAPKAEVPKTEKPEIPKTEAPTLLELRAILSKDRKKAAALLAEYGVAKLTDLDSSLYAELLAKAGGM